MIQRNNGAHVEMHSGIDVEVEIDAEAESEANTGLCAEAIVNKKLEKIAGFQILGIGTSLPDVFVDQPESASVIGRIAGMAPAKVAALFRMTKIRKRHFAMPAAAVADLRAGTDESGSPFVPRAGGDPYGPNTQQRMEAFAVAAPQLALQSARAALQASGVAPEEITHLVTVTCTGFGAPGLDIDLIRDLPLPTTTQRVQVGFMGCHGAVNGLRVARGLVAADPHARVLLVAAEVTSLHFRYQANSDQMVANALFGDGSAAVVGQSSLTAPAAALESESASLTEDPSRVACKEGNGKPSAPWRVADAASCWFPESAEAMSWSIGNHGFVMTLSPKVPTIISGGLRSWLEAWLKKHDLGLKDIASWAVHPGGPRILDAVVETLELPEDAVWASREVLADYGNMSSPTILFIIDRLQKAGAVAPCVALGFGPGLIAEAVLLL